MALPLPSVVANTGPGGQVVTAMRGMNALTGDYLGNEIQGVKAQYAPLTTQAEAASKLAYANLMGPQFLAKLMGNPNLLSNLTEDQKRNALSLVYGAGSGQGTGNALLGNLPNMQTNRHAGLSNLVQNIKNAFGFGSSAAAPAASQSESTNGLMQAPQQNTAPTETAVPTTPRTFAQNTGEYQGIVEQGKESGKLRAQDIKDLNDVAWNATNSQKTIDELGRIVSSPELEKIRTSPVGGHYQLSYYSKFGTPEQKQLIGRLQTTSKKFVADSSNQFKGAFREGEQTLLEGMKVNEDDSIDQAKGKIEATSYLNKMLSQRSQLTADYMDKYNIPKGKAMRMADQQINGEAIRQRAEEAVNPTVTIRNKKTGEVITIPRSEARKKYGVQ